MEGEISFQKDTNSTFNENFWVHNQQKELVRVIDQTLKKQSTMLIFASMLILSSSIFGSCLFSNQCLFSREYGTLMSHQKNLRMDGEQIICSICIESFSDVSDVKYLITYF